MHSDNEILEILTSSIKEKAIKSAEKKVSKKMKRKITEKRIKSPIVLAYYWREVNLEIYNIIQALIEKEGKK